MAIPKGTIVLTGANGGLGSAVVSQIATSQELRESYHGMYTVRNTASANSLDAALASRVHSHEKVALDLSDLSSVRKVAADINKRVAAGTIPRIHALILNAGFEEFTTDTHTQDGFDMAFAANYLGHWLLKMLLLQSMDLEVGRVLWISSWVHNPRDPRCSMSGTFKKEEMFDSDTVDAIADGTWSPTKDDKTGWKAGNRRYGASKLCGVTTISELQQRLDQDTKLHDVSILGIDPGMVSTGISRRHGVWLFRVCWDYLLPVIAAVMVYWRPNGSIRSVKKSAGDIVAAALADGPEPLSAKPKDLYLDGSQVGARNPEAKDAAKSAMLWRDTLRYARLEEGETCLENWR